MKSRKERATERFNFVFNKTFILPTVVPQEVSTCAFILNYFCIIFLILISFVFIIFILLPIGQALLATSI
jgi:cellulose synthase/poly-beta-1,6-N-acetylglucosamine synthase-like glycosyltransferase